ncbi:uncharacterized protein (TIGR04222 family) [Tahibacter aquaticus]|uniref:Uncharacterized protein (TIGR04222 family) n=1 Tax=Tahibacter aquaticus TaxID=520092 RepID=A0A4R6YYC3_9GAMM|nr:TIGR04222 domain-containing membrane protein [Tahibacter aquaticus]TDR44007.1 uncharacterized protein (TIGR04222 family) [Tahibacter aquaticus]
MSAVDTVWTDSQRELWQRIEQHDFGTGACALSFQRRLADEHNWSEADATAAIREYKRFCFLAVVASHTVTPPDAVDEVWHQHLTYSRDYWTRYCPEILGRPLHHEPTRGGAEQSRLHQRQYADTLASYQRWFGPPPLAWWPDARTQARQPAHYRRIDVAQHLLLPRWRWPRLRWPQLLLSAGLLAIAPALLALPANPLDFSGPEFLLTFGVLMVVCFVVSASLRARLRNTGGDTWPGVPLDAWSVAYLAGGTARVVDAGVASLLAAGSAHWNAKEQRLDVPHPNHIDEFPLAEIARASAAKTKAGKIPAQLDGMMTRRLREPLVQRGLLLDDTQRRRIGLFTALPFLLLTAFGLAKIAVGISRDRPVFFLCILTAFAVVMSLRRWFSTPTTSSAGDQLLRELNQTHAHVRRAPRDGDMALAVALAGTAVLAGTAYAGFHDYRSPASSGSSGDSGSSSCSSGDSGGGGGCGGCGGGGD